MEAILSKLDVSVQTHRIPYTSYDLPETIKYGKIFLRIGETIDHRFQKACMAEFIAMFFFVVICCGCAMVTLALPSPNLMMVAASFGFGIMCLAQFVGPLSGGHINCAVSFALFLGGRISFVRCCCYTASQCAGAFWGAICLLIIFGDQWPAARAFGSNSWDESVFTSGQVFFAEMMGTMLLVYTVFATIDIPTEGGGSLGVYPIAMSVMVAHLFLLPIDGCSINPSRSFGTSLVAAFAGIGGTYYHQQYMFWFGPMFGAGLAACIYEYAPLKPKKRENKDSMADALFLAKKKRGDDDDDENDDDDLAGSQEGRSRQSGSIANDDYEL